MAEMRGGGHLTLVYSGIPVLGVLDLQRPVLGVWLMDGSESLVARVRVSADCQEVNISMAHPGHLRRRLKCE